MSKNDGVYTPHVHYRTERIGKQVIDRETIEWFLNRALEYQDIRDPRHHNNLHFEIDGCGFIVTIWQRDFDEDGINAWVYKTDPTTKNYSLGGSTIVRDPYLVEARKHVEKFMEQVTKQWVERKKKERGEA